jgi:hypothetical protein
MRARRRFRSLGWMLWPGLFAAFVLLGPKRRRRVLSRLTRTLTDRALRALADTFREGPDPSEEAGSRNRGRLASAKRSPA